MSEPTPSVPGRRASELVVPAAPPPADPAAAIGGVLADALASAQAVHQLDWGVIAVSYVCSGC